MVPHFFLRLPTIERLSLIWRDCLSLFLRCPAFYERLSLVPFSDGPHLERLPNFFSKVLHLERLSLFFRSSFGEAFPCFTSDVPHLAKHPSLHLRCTLLLLPCLLFLHVPHMEKTVPCFSSHVPHLVRHVPNSSSDGSCVPHYSSNVLHLERLSLVSLQLSLI